MRQGEKFLSSGSEANLFLVGQNRRGNWVARDERGLRGGLFISRAAAVKFALFENGNQPQLVIAMPGALELDLSVSSFPAPVALPLAVYGAAYTIAWTIGIAQWSPGGGRWTTSSPSRG